MTSMKLTDRQKLVLSVIENNAELPLARVAARCKMRERTVRAAVERLIESGVAYPMHLINISALITNY